MSELLDQAEEARDSYTDDDTVRFTLRDGRTFEADWSECFFKNEIATVGNAMFPESVIESVEFRV